MKIVPPSQCDKRFAGFIIRDLIGSFAGTKVRVETLGNLAPELSPHRFATAVLGCNYDSNTPPATGSFPCTRRE